MIRAKAVLYWLPALTLAQNASYWRQTISNLPENPPTTTTAADVARFERSMQLAAPYFARVQPNDYAANRAMALRMASYLAGLQVLARDPQMRQALSQAQRTFNSLSLSPFLPYGYPLMAIPPPAGTEQQPPLDPGPALKAQEPPFPMSAPVLTGLSAADKATSGELCGRYEADAGRAAGAWQNAETLRMSLASRGMALNTATSGSLLRLPSYFNSASESLKRSDWESARTALGRAESETEKVMKSVGR